VVAQPLAERQLPDTINAIVTRLEAHRFAAAPPRVEDVDGSPAVCVVARPRGVGGR
jgi:hypothetical protein